MHNEGILQLSISTAGDKMGDTWAETIKEVLKTSYKNPSEKKARWAYSCEIGGHTYLDIGVSQPDREAIILSRVGREAVIPIASQLNIV